MKKILVSFISIFLFAFLPLNIVFADTPIYLVSLSNDSQNKFKEVKPGDKYKGELTVKLVDQDVVNFKLDVNSSIGNIIALGGEGTSLDLQTWFNFYGKDTFTLDGSNEELNTINIPYEITIPESIMPADYSVVLAVGIVDERESNVKQGAGVVFSTAIGIPLKFSVVGDRIPKLEFNDMNFIDYTDYYIENELHHDLILGFEYQNLGNAVLNVFADVEVRDFLGEEYIIETVDLGGIFPGITDKDEYRFQDIGKFIGWLNVNANIFYNPVDLDGKIMDERIKAGHASLKVYSIPWFELLVFFILLFAVVLFLFIKYFRIKSLRESSKIYVVKKGDTLQSVCSKYSVDFKSVVLANKLKSPYFLQEGTKLYIPKKK